MFVLQNAFELGPPGKEISYDIGFASTFQIVTFQIIWFSKFCCCLSQYCGNGGKLRKNVLRLLQIFLDLLKSSLLFPLGAAPLLLEICAGLLRFH